jgi:hypothetical protein
VKTTRLTNFIHTFFKWGWCTGHTTAVAVIYFHWLLELESGILPIVAACVLFAISCLVGELCLTFSGIEDQQTGDA